MSRDNKRLSEKNFAQTVEGGERFSLIGFNLSGSNKEIIAKYVWPNDGWIRMTSDGKGPTNGLVASDFGVGLAVIISSEDNKYISLRRISPFDDGKKIIKDEKEYLEELTKGSQKFDVRIGISINEISIAEKGIEELLKAEAETRNIKNVSKVNGVVARAEELKSATSGQIISIENAIILVNKDGSLKADIEFEDMRNLQDRSDLLKAQKHQIIRTQLPVHMPASSASSAVTAKEHEEIEDETADIYEEDFEVDEIEDKSKVAEEGTQRKAPSKSINPKSLKSFGSEILTERQH